MDADRKTTAGAAGETSVDARLAQLVASRQPGHSLPAAFYTDEDVYRREIDEIWRRSWLVAGHSCQLAAPGDYITFELADDSVLVIRGDDGRIRALHNVCRHRGTLLTTESEGRVGRLVCPYHQWTYARDGQLLSCRGMPADFDRAAWSLRPVAVEEVAGLVFLCLAEEPPPFAPARETLQAMLPPQGLAAAKVACAIDYQIDANWKIVWENNRECYHCNANHPQYIKANFDHYNADDTTPRIRDEIDTAVRRSEEKWAAAGLAVSHRQTGMTIFPDVASGCWYSANRTPLVEGYLTESMDGQLVAPLMGDYTAADVGTLRVRTVPNFWNHSSADHSVSTQLAPAGLRQTRARVTWLVRGDAVPGRDYTLERLCPFWQLTSEQDWELCRRVQRGVVSSGYRPGPFSRDKEYNVENFVRWYLTRLVAAEHA